MMSNDTQHMMQQQESSSTSMTPPALTAKCSTIDCAQTATLACPTCIKLNVVPVSRFCSQSCFRSSWKQHQIAVHAKYQQAALFQPPAFAYTSALRPAYVTPQIDASSLPAHIARPDYALSGVPVSELAAKSRENQGVIPVYTSAQIAGIRKACLIGRHVLDYAHTLIRPGITGDEIDQLVHAKCIEFGAYPSPLNYHNFPKSVCISVNEVICHGIPDMRVLQIGDIVNIDISVYYQGFHGDLNETFAVGEVDADSERVLRTSYECLMIAIKHCKPGNYCRDFGDIIQKHATKKRCSVVKTYCGHGIGSLFHCAPNIPHYSKNKAIGQLRAGMVYTIEPMINLGDWRDVTWPDGWTAVTKDGLRSSQFEHTILITDTGCEILTARLPTSPPLDFNLDAETHTQ